MSVATRSIKVGRAYRDFCRAVLQRFESDSEAIRQMKGELRKTLRGASLPVEEMVQDIQSGTDMIRYQVLQAAYQPEKGVYKVQITQDHLKHGEVIHLQEPTDPATWQKQ
mmetsp:Transcript_65361/g.156270  ORF Transcript_65361/g.156270 Transcript_65361/m.156270 type:complete len:110 (+) Transcript_65361:55-384(+)